MPLNKHPPPLRTHWKSPSAIIWTIGYLHSHHSQSLYPTLICHFNSTLIWIQFSCFFSSLCKRPQLGNTQPRETLTTRKLVKTSVWTIFPRNPSYLSSPTLNIIKKMVSHCGKVVLEIWSDDYQMSTLFLFFQWLRKRTWEGGLHLPAFSQQHWNSTKGNTVMHFLWTKSFLISDFK